MPGSAPPRPIFRFESPESIEAFLREASGDYAPDRKRSAFDALIGIPVLAFVLIPTSRPFGTAHLPFAIVIIILGVLAIVQAATTRVTIAPAAIVTSGPIALPRIDVTPSELDSIVLAEKGHRLSLQLHLKDRRRRRVHLPSSSNGRILAAAAASGEPLARRRIRIRLTPTAAIVAAAIAGVAVAFVGAMVCASLYSEVSHAAAFAAAALTIAIAPAAGTAVGENAPRHSAAAVAAISAAIALTCLMHALT